MMLLRTLGLFVATALCEIMGCFLPYLWLRQQKTAWLLLPAAASLATFAWLLSLHPSLAGRTYAAYGGVYIASALVWLWLTSGQVPDRWDLAGGTLCLIGAATIVVGRHTP
jgi:small multidrug resistance family-3 protein